MAFKQIQKQSLDRIQLRIYNLRRVASAKKAANMNYNGTASSGSMLAPLGASQHLNLPSPKINNIFAKVKSASAQSQGYLHKSTNQEAPQSLAARHSNRQSFENTQQSSKGSARFNQNAYELDSQIQQAPKTLSRKQKTKLRKQTSRISSPNNNYMTPKYLKSSPALQQLHQQSAVSHRRTDSLTLQANRPVSTHEKQKPAMTAQPKRPPLRSLPQNANSQGKAPPLPPTSTHYLQQQQLYQKRPPSRGIHEQGSYSNSNLMAHTSSCESTPQISAVNTFAHPVLQADRSVCKQESDPLVVSDERQKQQLEDFNSAKTSLYEFQVRKSPTPSQQHDESGAIVHLQIPLSAKNKDLQMFQHPYGKMVPSADQSCEESTRWYTKRNADSSLVTANSRAIHVNASELSAASSSVAHNKEQKERTLTQSLFSALGSLIQGGSGKSSEQHPQSSRQTGEEQTGATNFSSKASATTKIMAKRNEQSNSEQENPAHIQIIEGTEPTEMNAETSFASQQVRNERSNSNQNQWLQSESELLPEREQFIQSENSMRLNTLTKLSNQNWRAFMGVTGRNDILKTQSHMNGFSNFSGTRSPMKRRKFTRPPIKPQEDEIVDSMNIVTLDMVPEPQQAAHMHISEPDEPRGTCNACSDCLGPNRLDELVVSEQYSGNVPAIQQRPTTLRDQTVCSCSGCMASQTAYEPQHNEQMTASAVRPTRICLETVLSECDQIRSLLSLLKQPRSTQLMILNQKKILLDRIQTYCEEWWGASSQFHNLHAVFEQDGTVEGLQVSNLIKKSQVVLCVVIGLIASLSIDVQSNNLERVIICQTFWLPKLILHDAYMVQMKLSSIILLKMDGNERRKNEFAVNLQERINAYREETGATDVLPYFNEEANTSTASLESENATELETLLSSLVENQVNLLEQQCTEYVPALSQNLELYRNLFTVADSQIHELNVAKDLIANEVNAIQEKMQPQNLSNTDGTTDQDAYGTTQPDDMSRHSNGHRHPPSQPTPQQPSSTNTSVAEPVTTIPIEEHLQQKQRILTQGHLSEIGEEPINVLSTEQNVQPSVERDISRISSNHSSLATKNLALSQQMQSSERKTLTAAEGAISATEHQQSETPEDRLREATEQVCIELATAKTPRKQMESSLLPPSTKRYTLVLDLDETLIHSHVQQKQVFKTRQQQQEYFNELAQKFYAEHRRHPTKEELENLALEMVFNIRPFAEEFLNTMAKDFELVIFTAGEQDYADEILNTLDQACSITHRLYRQHTVQVRDQQSGATKHYIKDLTILGRPSETMIIIDNIKENFCRQPRNGIQITTWKDDPYDTELIYLQRLLLNMAGQHPGDLRVNLDRLKDHGLLPQHFAEPIYDDSSSSFQHFEPVVVTATPLDERVKQEYSAHGANMVSSPSKKQQQQRQDNNSQSMVSIDSSSRTNSIRKQSVTNSAYQRRRLSAQKFESESPEGGAKQQYQGDSQENFAVPDCFFVDELPIQVDLELETPNIAAEGKIVEEEKLLSSERAQAYNKNSAFVEPSQKERDH